MVEHDDGVVSTDSNLESDGSLSQSSSSSSTAQTGRTEEVLAKSATFLSSRFSLPETFKMYARRQSPPPARQFTSRVSHDEKALRKRQI